MPRFKPLSLLTICLALWISQLAAAQDMVRIYAKYSFTSNGETSFTPIRFLELLADHSFHWARQDTLVPGGSYELTGRSLFLRGAIPAQGIVVGGGDAGSVQFVWVEGGERKVLVMCITSSIAWPPKKERCQ
jgi:hypothetical protein